VESLEDRCVPTTHVVLNSGILTITGDANNNGITITEQATAGAYVVDANDIAGSHNQAFSGVNSIVVNTGSGSDVLTLVGNAAAATALAGNLSVSGSGNLTVTSTSGSFNVNGQLAITETGSGSLSANLQGPGSTFGSVTISSGGGGALLNFENGVRVAQTLSVGLGAGANRLTLQTGGGAAVQVGGSLTVSGTTGQDNVTLDGATIGGAVSINDSHAASVTAAIAGSGIGTFLSVVGGAGNDALSLTSSSVGQNLGLALGGGTNSVSLSGSTVTGNLFTSGATGTELLTVGGGTIVSGYLSVNDPAAIAVNVGIANSTVRSYLSVISGAGSDVVTLTGASVGQNLGLSLGAGINSVSVLGSTVAGSFFENNDTGIERVTVGGGTIIGGYVSVNDPAAVALNVSIANTGVGTYLSVIGGAGNDSVSIGSAKVGQNLGVSLGTGTDVLSVNHTTVTGSLFETDLGTATTLISSTTVQQNLSLDTSQSTTRDALNLLTDSVGGNLTLTTGQGNDTIQVGGTTVVKGTSISTGAGNDTVTLYDSGFSGTTGINVGNGNNALNVEATTTADSQSTSFFGPVTVVAGTGNDTVTLGLAASDLAKFFASASFNGGGGTNVLSQTFAQFLGGPPTITGF
jgi:hypothetical protein